ncbi:MAG: DUF2239 family protein [Polyangiaceae bacterium]|nr:DUF2239 family protein [Polyangiaceae bacterium]
MQPLTYVAFVGARRVAEGSLPEVLPALKQRFDAGRAELALVFERETGRQVEFDLRGSLGEALARAEPEAPRGPGRPRLGVTGREVTLLPRHWDWLDQQPSGASASLRRLVEQAMKADPEGERARLSRAALARVLTAIAGDRPGFEEACRALYAGEIGRFTSLVSRWPRDVRAYAEARLAG